MVDQSHLLALSDTTRSLFQQSTSIFWTALPVCVLISFLSIYLVGDGITGAKIEGLFRRIFIAIALLAAFNEISGFVQGLEDYLVTAFGGDSYIQEIFSKLASRADAIKQAGQVSWVNVGAFGINIIATLSFLILAIVRHFLDMLHLIIWNLLHVLGPVALLGCVFPSFIQVPKGVFLGMLELALWKPIWVILARLLISVGYADSPQDISQWFDTAVLNFAVAGLMASTPMIARALLSGTIGGLGGSMVQTMASGVGGFLAAQPMRMLQRGAGSINQGARSMFSGAVNHIRSENSDLRK